MSSFAHLLNFRFFKSCTTPVIVCMYIDSYPLMLSQLLLSRERKTEHVERIDLASYDLDALMLATQTTFLGQTFCYWVVGVQELSDKKRALFLQFLQNYSGPHKIIVWLPGPITGHTVVEIPEIVQKDHIAALVPLVTGHEDIPSVLINESNRLLMQYKKLSVEQALQLLVYVIVAAGDREAVFKEWGGTLIQVDQSLFTLSQYLFSQNQKKFRQLYDTMTSYFQDTFWISFWADQVWRAIHVIDAYNVKDFAGVKTYGARLPFSFINTDWRKYNKADLIKTHNLLYTFDYQLKNGIESELDLFYFSFFK